MKGCIRLLLGIITVAYIVGCASSQVEDEQFDGGDQAAEGGGRGDDGGDMEKSSADKGITDEFADQGVSSSEEDFATDQPANTKKPKVGMDSFADDVSEAPPPPSQNEFADNGKKSDPFDDAGSKDMSFEDDKSGSDFMPDDKPMAKGASKSASSGTGGKSVIKNIRYEENDNGGTVIVESDNPVTYTSRLNDHTNQFVVEIETTRLPKSLRRPYVTKDFHSSVGSIDAYQNPGSDIARVVIQLREGAEPPAIQQEGSSLLIVTGNKGAPPVEKTDEESGGTNSLLGDSNKMEINRKGILSSKNLDDFLSSNMKFFGKKISIEMKDVAIRDVINMLAEESGANLVLSESVTGSLSLKLRNVPWDQALVMVLKAKKLGYVRQGNILRITAMSELKQEEDDAIKQADTKKRVDPLVIQMLPINYSKIEDLKTQVTTLLSERGKAVADSRTSALIITDTEEVVDRVKKMVASLDVPPAQVLIEGKIVEARESFEKKVGIQWDVLGQDINLGNGAKGPMNLTPSISVTPGINRGSALGVNLRIGNIDMLGDLSAMLALEEREDNVKIISSPRIVTLHNEKASITQSSEIPILTSSSSTDTIKNTTRSVTFKPVKMNLDVTPQVANNGNVILTVNVQREFVGAIVDEATGAAAIHNRQASTKVMVKNGQTAVIGGIYQNDNSSKESGVPFLKDIPILGFFFRSDNYVKDKTELLLFLTPRILSQIGTTSMSNKDISNMGME